MRVEILKYDLLSREGTQIEYSVTDVIMATLKSRWLKHFTKHKPNMSRMILDRTKSINAGH